MIPTLDIQLFKRTKTFLPRIGAAALLAAAIGLIWFVCIEPLRDRFGATAQQISDEQAVISRLKAVVALEPTLKTALSNTDEAAFKNNFLVGAEDTLVIADLQTKLRSLAVRHKAQLNSARALPVKTVNGLSYLGLKLELRGDLRDIQQIIHGIETSDPLLFIEKLSLRPTTQANAGRTMSQSSAHLLAELDVFGAKWPRPPAEAGTPK